MFNLILVPRSEVKYGKKSPVHEEEIIYVAKSELKRDAHELRDLGKEICALSKKDRATLPLNEDLIEAFEFADKISHKTEAFRRHLNFIGKQLRLSEQVEQIKESFQTLKDLSKKSSKKLQQLEEVRDQLIAEGDKKINDLIGQFPDLDRQRMRQLVRQAKKEHQQNKPAKAYREIFQYLKSLTLGQ